MNSITPPFLRQIDAWLLLNSPRIWATQVHHLLWYLLCGSVLAAACAFIPSVDVDLMQYKSFDVDNALQIGFMAVIAFIVLVLWLTTFRASFRTFNYKEALLSIVAGAAILLFFYFFINIYRVVLEQRKANHFDKTLVERDLLLTYMLNKASDSRTIVTKTEDLKIQDYTLTKKECDDIRTQVTFYKILQDRDLGGYVEPDRDSLYQDLDDDQRRQLTAQLDREFKVFHFNAVDYCTIVPDSIRQLYFSLSEKRTVLPAFEEHFLRYGIKKISPTANMLLDKYSGVEGNVSDMDQGTIRNLERNLPRYFALQQTPFLERFLNSYSFYFNEQNQYDSDSGEANNTFEITNEQVHRLQNEMDELKNKSYFGGFWYFLSILLFMPLLILLSIVHFGIRDTLIGVLCFIVPFLLNILFVQLVFSNDYNSQSKNIFFILQLLATQGIVFYFFFKKGIKQRRFVQVFLPFSILATLCTIPFLISYIEGFVANQHPDDNNYWDSEYWHYIAYTIYTVIVLPFAFVLYHRLAFLPKNK